MRPLSHDLTKSSPLRSDFLSPASVGEAKQPVVIVLTLSLRFHLLFSQPPHSEEGFIPSEKPSVPKDLHP